MKAREIRKLERARQHNEMKAYCKKIDRAFSRLSEGCSNRVINAITTATTLGMMGKEVSEGSACMPEIAIFAAGHRKVRKDATHIIK